MLGYWKAAAGVVEGLLQKGSEMAVAATTFREDMVATFEGLGKSAATSERLYQRAIALAIKLGRDPALLATEFKRLSAAGFKDNQLASITKMLADVAAVKGDSKANQFEKILEKMNAKGSLDARVITALTTQGFSQNRIYAALAKTLNKPVADIPGLIKTGKIDAKVAIDAISKVVEGKVGGVAGKLASSIPALLTRVKLAFSTLFDGVDTSPIKNVLKTVLNLLTGPAGGAMKKGLTSLFGNLFELLFGPMKNTGRIEAVFAVITAVIARVAGFIKGITPGVHAFINGFLAGFKNVSPVLGKVGGTFLDLIQKLGGATAVARQVGKGFGFVAGVLAFVAEIALTTFGAVTTLAGAFLAVSGAIWGVISDIASALPGVVSGLIDWISNLGATMISEGMSVGSSLIDGMVEGLTSGLGAALAAAGAVANAIVAHVKAILGIHSPSEVFGEIGYYSAAGFAQGFDAHGSKAAAAAARMASGAAHAATGVGSYEARSPKAAAAATRMAPGATDAAVGIRGFGPAAGTRGVTGRSGNVIHVTFAPGAIVVGHGASAQAGGDQALARLIREEIDAYFRRWGEAA